MVRRMLDLCAGKKGASSAFSRAGWQVVGVDVDPSMKPDILIDVRDLARMDLGGMMDELGGTFDFVWASPPCQEFSLAPRCPRPDHPDVSILLACLDVIEMFNPPSWCVENVRGAVRFFGAPTLSDDRTWFFWGQFPGCIEIPAIRKRWIGGKKRRHLEAAKIPEEVSERFRRAIDAHFDEGWTSIDPRRHGKQIIERIREATSRESAPAGSHVGSSRSRSARSGPAREGSSSALSTSGVSVQGAAHVESSRSIAHPRREGVDVDRSRGE